MAVSVVIPTYNRCRELERALNSVLSQTIQPEEVIIVDDGSNDQTLNMLQQYEKQDIKIIHQANRGVSAARNRGVEEGGSEWIAFLDSDDWWLPDKLQKQINFHREYPQFLISQTNEIWIRHNVRVNPKKYHEKRAGWIFHICLERCMITPSAVMINRQIFEDVGFFDQNLPACEDYDLWLRVACKYPVGLIKEELVVKTGGHSDQLSGKYWGMDRFRVKALEKLLEHPLDPEKRRNALDTLIKKSGILAQGSLKRNKPDIACLYQEKVNRYQAQLEGISEVQQSNG